MSNVAIDFNYAFDVGCVLDHPSLATGHRFSTKASALRQ